MSMKKLSALFILCLLVLLATTGLNHNPALAASGLKATDKPGPFEGTFTGTVSGDKRSEASLDLELTQRGSLVAGEVTLGDGLYIDGGMCGKGYIPAGATATSGESLSDDPNHLVFNAEFPVSNFKIKVVLQGDLTEDGKILTAEAAIDLPWFCGHDPQLQAELTRNEAAAPGLSFGKS
jgi:hypothetical protein